MAKAKGAPGRGPRYNPKAKLDPSQIEDRRTPAKPAKKAPMLPKRAGNAAAKDKRRTMGR